MRQFTYKYNSYIKNKHGFATFVPHKKFFHPYLGFTGAAGYSIFQTAASPMYSEMFCAKFDGGLTFKHFVEIKFNEIRNGFLYVDDVKYNVASSENDEVTVSHKVNVGSKYREYVEIKDFVAKFDIDIFVNMGERKSVESPVVISPMYIDVFVFNQRISIISHKNSATILPYYMPYRTDFPPEIARMETSGANLTTNEQIYYGFVIDDSTASVLSERGLDVTRLDTSLIEAKDEMIYLTEEAVVNEQSSFFDIDDITSLIGDKSEYYTVKLPESIFPYQMELDAEVPIFDSEKNMKCCKYVEMGLCSPYHELYQTNVPPFCQPHMCLDDKCINTPQYEIRNKVIDKYLTLAMRPIEVLDSLFVEASVGWSKHRKLQQEIIVEE